MRPSRRQNDATRLRFSAAVLALLITAAAWAAPYRPSSPDEVLLELDGAAQRAVSNSTALRAAAASRTDPNASAIIAQEFIDLGRSQNDERYFGYAAAALQPWNARRDAPVRIAVLQADIAQHQHRFTEALRMLDDVIVRDGKNARARLMRATLQMTQGQPQLALRDCQKLLVLRASFAATVCIAQASSLNGKLAASYRLLSEMLQHPIAAGDVDQYAWAFGVAGEMAERLGDSNAAEMWLRKAIEQAPNDLVSRLQLCDVLLRRDQAQTVLNLLHDAPASEPVLLRRALAEQRLARTEALADWNEAASRSEQLGIRLHLRELARGQLELLHRPQEALATARQNWAVQREPADARVLAMAARAAGDRETLEQLSQWRDEQHLEDVELML